MGQLAIDRSPTYAQTERTRQEYVESNYVGRNQAGLQLRKCDARYKSYKKDPLLKKQSFYTGKILNSSSLNQPGFRGSTNRKAGTKFTIVKKKRGAGRNEKRKNQHKIREIDHNRGVPTQKRNIFLERTDCQNN